MSKISSWKGWRFWKKQCLVQEITTTQLSHEYAPPLKRTEYGFAPPTEEEMRKWMVQHQVPTRLVDFDAWEPYIPKGSICPLCGNRKETVITDERGTLL